MPGAGVATPPIHIAKPSTKIVFDRCRWPAHQSRSGTFAGSRPTVQGLRRPCRRAAACVVQEAAAVLVQRPARFAKQPLSCLACRQRPFPVVAAALAAAAHAAAAKAGLPRNQIRPQPHRWRRCCLLKVDVSCWRLQGAGARELATAAKTSGGRRSVAQAQCDADATAWNGTRRVWRLNRS